jgi:hypothetical protein
MVRFRTTSFVLSLCAALVPAIALAADNNGGGEAAAKAAAADALANGPADNHGHFVCTAAIMADGAVFSGEYVNATLTFRIAPGTYQVAFNAPCPNVQIANGWFRVCQADTLTIGTLPARSCTLADRFGVPSAVWVQFFNSAGTLTDTPFTLHVSR